MPFSKILCDLKLVAVRLYQGNHLPLDDILDCLKMSESTFYRVLSLWNTTGDIVRHTFGICGHPWVLHFDDVDYLKWLVKACPDWFLDELLSLLESNRIISAHYSTIYCKLVSANVSTKKLKTITAERMRNYGLTSCDAWHNMNLSNWAFLTKFQRMKGHLANNEDDQGKALSEIWKVPYKVCNADNCWLAL